MGEMQTTFVMIKPDGVQRGLVADIIGPTDGRTAAPGTIRGDFAMDIGHNVIHGSDGEDTAAFELGLWFPDGLVQWSRDAETHIYE